MLILGSEKTATLHKIGIVMINKACQEFLYLGYSPIVISCSDGSWEDASDTITVSGERRKIIGVSTHELYLLIIDKDGKPKQIFFDMHSKLLSMGIEQVFAYMIGEKIQDFVSKNILGDPVSTALTSRKKLDKEKLQQIIRYIAQLNVDHLFQSIAHLLPPGKPLPIQSLILTFLYDKFIVRPREET